MSLETEHAEMRSDDTNLSSVSRVRRSRGLGSRLSIGRVTQAGLLALLIVTGAFAVGLTSTAVGAVEESDDGGNGTLELVKNTSTDETVTVDLQTSASNVAGYQTELRYDADVLEVMSVEGVAFDDPVTNDSESGVVVFTQSNDVEIDEPILAMLTFEIVDDGETDLEFVSEDNETVVNDLNGTYLDVLLEELTLEATDEESGGIGGSVEGDNSGDTTESDPEDTEPDDDDVSTNDTVLDDTGAGDDEVDDTDAAAADEETRSEPDEKPTDEDDPSSDDKSDAITDAVPFLPGGLVTVVLGVLIVLTLLKARSKS